MFKWLYQFIFINQHNGELSHTKAFSVIGYVIMCWAFVYSILHGNEVDYSIWLLFGAIVVGNKTVLKLFENKGLKDG